MTVKAILIPVEGAPELIDVEPKDIGPKILGGWLEFIPLADDAHAYVDEEGKIKGLPMNRLATKIASIPGDAIAGPMVILGMTADGDEADVPHHIVQLVLDA